jgi:hypothetical protein
MTPQVGKPPDEPVNLGRTFRADPLWPDSASRGLGLVLLLHLVFDQVLVKAR